MESPNGHRSALWDAVQDAEDRAAGDFFNTPARDALALPGGDEQSVVGGTGPPAATLSSGHRPHRTDENPEAGVPVTAADVADRVVALHAAGQKPIEIAMTLQITVGEVRGVLRDAERPPGTPHHGGLLRPR